MNTEIKKMMNVSFKLFLSTLITLTIVFVSIALVNSFINIIFSEKNILRELKSAFAYNLSTLSVVILITYPITLVTQDLDIFLSFTQKRENISKTFIYLIFGLSIFMGFFLFNIIKLFSFLDFSERKLGEMLYLQLITILGIYLFANFIHFISLIGKKYGSKYVFGILFLAASFILINIIRIQEFILFGENKLLITIFFVISSAIFVFSNNKFVKKAENKN